MDACQTKFQPSWFLASVKLNQNFYAVLKLKWSRGKNVCFVPRIDLEKGVTIPGCKAKS